MMAYRALIRSVLAYGSLAFTNWHHPIQSSQLGDRSPTFVSLKKTKYVKDPRKKSFGQGIRETVKELRLKELVINEHDPPSVAPWTLPIPPVNLDLLQKTNKKNYPIAARALSLEHMEYKWPSDDWEHVYTDKNTGHFILGNKAR
ncbi:hypothetical protein SNE40_018319 [Patella caerulea]|uniref:Uncharacterized protein n=1 Tax=Patella caerulea TaxID=87958 RepID=A0AAN8PH04_PATCE